MDASPRRRQQIGLPAILAAFGLLSLWFGWAEVVCDVADHEAAIAAIPADAPPLVVFNGPICGATRN